MRKSSGKRKRNREAKENSKNETSFNQQISVKKNI